MRIKNNDIKIVENNRIELAIVASPSPNPIDDSNHTDHDHDKDPLNDSGDHLNLPNSGLGLGLEDGKRERRPSDFAREMVHHLETGVLEEKQRKKMDSEFSPEDSPRLKIPLMDYSIEIPKTDHPIVHETGVELVVLDGGQRGGGELGAEQWPQRSTTPSTLGPLPHLKKHHHQQKNIEPRALNVPYDLEQDLADELGPEGKSHTS